MFSGGVCHLEPVRSSHGWAMSGLIDIKALKLSFQGKRRKKNRFYMSFWKRQNCGNNKKISGGQEFGGRGERNTTESRSFYEQ